MAGGRGIPLAGLVAALRQVSDWRAPIAPQLALAGFIADGLLDRHLRRSRRIYARRHQILQSALSGPLAAALTSLGFGAVTAADLPAALDSLGQALGGHRRT
jgi:DNA-binding transcriptional MocR family regulator